MKKIILLTLVALLSNFSFAQHEGHDHDANGLCKLPRLTAKDFRDGFNPDAYSLSQFEIFVLQTVTNEMIYEIMDLPIDFTNLSVETRDIVHFISEQKRLWAKEIAKKLKSGELKTKEQGEDELKRFALLTKSSIQAGKYPKNIFTKPKTPESTTRVWDGPCVNMDFEQGNTNGWELFLGRNYNSGPYDFQNPLAMGPNAHHQIITAPAMDPIIPGLTATDPAGGTYSLRLGNGASYNGLSYGDAAMARQSFLVTPDNAIFTYSYAIVVENPGAHSNNELAYFTVRVFDQGGNNVNCGSYNVVSTASNPDFINSGITNGFGEAILYQPWKTVFAPLDDYIGQNVTIEFIAADCSLGGHYGYAYIDANCGGTELTASGDFICGDDPVTLYAPPGAASYAWNTGANTETITVNQPGTYTCTVTPLQGGACAVTLSITIDGAPNPVANFTPSPALICAGNDITFTDNSTVSEGTIATWQWNFGDGTTTNAGSGELTGVTNTSGTYAIPVHIYDNPGAYSVQLTVVTEAGCSNSTTIQINVQDAPQISAGPDQFLCSGDTFIPEGQGGVSYTWDSNLTNGQGVTVEAGTFTYTVTGYDDLGCSSTATVTLFVDETPVLNAGEDVAICIGEEVTLNGSGAPSYTWSGGIQDGVPFSPNTTGVYTVSYTSPNGCTGTDQVTVTVNSLPTIGGNSPAVCDGQSVTLNGTGGVSYEWSNDVVNGQPFNQPAGTQTYTVTGTDANGCVNTGQVTVTVYEYPNAAFTVDQTEGIPPHDVLITNESTGNITGYNWSFGNGNSSIEGFISTNQTYYAPGNPSIVLIVNNNGCADTAIVTLTIAFPPLEYHVPNVITANGDGNNDVYHLGLVNASELEMVILNRWGNVMAEIYDVNGGWDGRTKNGALAAEGVYFVKYKITALTGEIVEGHTFFHLFH
jgi:gliding motility-associated-like protein